MVCIHLAYAASVAVMNKHKMCSFLLCSQVYLLLFLLFFLFFFLLCFASLLYFDLNIAV